MRNEKENKSDRRGERERERIKEGGETLVECTSCTDADVYIYVYIYICIYIYTSASYPTRQGHYRIITFHTYRATTMMGGRLASTERGVERECRPRSGTRDLSLSSSKAANGDHSHSRATRRTRLPRTIVRHAHVRRRGSYL